MLQKQTITIPLGLGVNTKTDEKLLEQGAFNLVTENATFDKVGSVKKRQGLGVYSNTYYILGSANGTSGTISGLTNKPVCVAGLGKQIFLKNKLGEYLYSHDQNFIYNNEGPLPEARITSKSVYSSKSSVDVTDLEFDSDENILCVVVRDGFVLNNSDGGSQVILYDVTNETALEGLYITNAFGANRFGFIKAGVSRVSGTSYYYHVSVNSNNVLFIQVYNKNGQVFPGSVSQANILADGTTTATKGPIAGCRSSNGETFYIIVPTTTASTGRIIGLRQDSAIFNTTFTYTGTGWKSATAVYDNSTNTIKFAYVQDSGQVNTISFNNDGSINTANAVLTGATGAISISYDNDNNNRLLVNTPSVYRFFQSGSYTRQLVNGYINSDKVTVNGSPVVVVNDLFGFNTFMLSGFDPGQRGGERIFARLAPGLGRNFNSQLTRIAKINDDTVVVALPRLSADNGDYKTYNLQLTFADLSIDHKSGSRQVIGPNLHLQGGVLAEFDGQYQFENGFLNPAAPPSLVTTSSGSLSGNFGYCLVLKYTDKNGQITRSAPSSIVQTGSITGKSVDIQIKTMPFGLKSRNCKVEIYRTLAGGSTFYFLEELSTDMGAYSTANVAVINDDTPDLTISNNGILYTTGDVLPNDPAPSCKSVAQGGNRLFLAGLEDENEVAYSKKKLFGECVNFSDFFRIRFDTSQFNITGGLTAIGYMDDKLIAFKKNSIFFVSGDGPNETGANDTFTPPELVSADTGCTDPRSVVLTPVGIMFKGEKGIYLLNRGLSTEYIGAPVEQYNALNVSSAVLVESKNLVKFTILGINNNTQKLVLVYDYFTQQWDVDNGIAGLDSDVIDGDHVILDASTNHPLVQNTSNFLDNGSTYAMRVVTPWIKVSGIQDYARIWRAYILGKYKSAHTLIVKAYYDYSDSYSETFTISPSATDAQYQYVCHLRKQKCESVKFEIFDSNISGESMELTALTLEVGVKKGSMKLAAARKY